ncbi:hypothetical protein P4K49_30605 [Bacillus cereus]|uniref:hypothetical protein n=1 Tax=Bacillus thuringiensis TaxID=1428 RepID=UPI00188E4D3E|nr:hypothetical protein [Bacillus thuringiensis]MEB9619168.1 hypothetical protein [Bacillus cereus]MEB9643654.1 hypothetical protein [Bacillus cereus]MEB9644177.1 hypothetical protein [Bacillus cereus]MEB9716503.1 hypothetical protein [Bacillus cereus]MEB9734206.1 hypothetical protein [Bacillus cereus]
MFKDVLIGLFPDKKVATEANTPEPEPLERFIICKLLGANTLMNISLSTCK